MSFVQSRMSGVLVLAVVLLARAVSADTLGSPADISQFPGLVQVEFHVGPAWVRQCAGSVITNAHILTSAACVSGPKYRPEDRRIRAGSTTSGLGGQVVPVARAVLHPNYGLLGRDADIAIVRLYDDDLLELVDESVQQVMILGQGIELPLGLAVTHAGWGSTAEGNKEADHNLYSLELFVNDNDSCLGQYIFTEIITENMICVGLSPFNQGRDFDPSDAGSPLFFEDTLVGLLSFGAQDDDRLPVVATAVGSFTQWIIDNASD